MQHFSQIVPRVCTSVLFISFSSHNVMLLQESPLSMSFQGLQGKPICYKDCVEFPDTLHIHVATLLACSFQSHGIHYLQWHTCIYNVHKHLTLITITIILYIIIFVIDIKPNMPVTREVRRVRTQPLRLPKYPLDRQCRTEGVNTADQRSVRACSSTYVHVSCISRAHTFSVYVFII